LKKFQPYKAEGPANDDCGKEHPKAFKGFCVQNQEWVDLMKKKAGEVTDYVEDPKCEVGMDEKAQAPDNMRKSRECGRPVMKIIKEAGLIASRENMASLMGSIEARKNGVKCWDPASQKDRHLCAELGDLLYMPHNPPPPQKYRLRVAPECMAPLEAMRKAGDKNENLLNRVFGDADKNSATQANCFGGPGFVLDEEDFKTKEEWDAMVATSCYSPKIFEFLTKKIANVQMYTPDIAAMNKMRDDLNAKVGKIGKAEAKKKDAGAKFRFAEQSVSVSNIPADAKELGESVCDAAKKMVALLKTADKRSQKMKQLLVTITSIGDNSRKLLEIVEQRVVELNKRLKNSQEKRAELTIELEKLDKEIDEKKKTLGGIELETAMTKDKTKDIKDKTADIKAQTDKVKDQTKEQEDFINQYASEIVRVNKLSVALKLKKSQLDNDIADAMWELELSQEDLKGAKNNLNPALVAFNYCNSFDCYDPDRVSVPPLNPPQKAMADTLTKDMGFVDPPTEANIPNDSGKVEKFTVAALPEIPFNANEFGCDSDACSKKGELACVQASAIKSTKQSLQKAAAGLLKHYKEHPQSDWAFKLVGNYHCKRSGNPKKDYCTKLHEDDPKFKEKIKQLKYDDPFAPGYKFDETSTPKKSILENHKNMVGYPNLKTGRFYEKGKCRAIYIQKQFLKEAEAVAGKDDSLKGALEKLKQSKTLCADGFEYYQPYFKVSALVGQKVCDGY